MSTGNSGTVSLADLLGVGQGLGNSSEEEEDGFADAGLQRRVAACGYLRRFEMVKAGECSAAAGRERVIGCGVRLG